MGAFQQTKAQELVTVPQAVLNEPTADPSRFRVIEVVKGERPEPVPNTRGGGRRSMTQWSQARLTPSPSGIWYHLIHLAPREAGVCLIRT